MLYAWLFSVCVFFLPFFKRKIISSVLNLPRHVYIYVLFKYSQKKRKIQQGLNLPKDSVAKEKKKEMGTNNYREEGTYWSEAKVLTKLV